MLNEMFVKLSILRDPNMKMCTLVVYPGPSSFPQNDESNSCVPNMFWLNSDDGDAGVLVPRSGQLSYSIYVSKRDSCFQQYL